MVPTPLRPLTAIRIERSPSPFFEVTAGSVRALIPDGWQPMPTDRGAPVRGSSRPRARRHGRGWTGPRRASRPPGSTRRWSGVPSDFYYLAATGPLFSQLIHSPECRAESSRVLIDNLPAFASGAIGSPGDYMARGEGTCKVEGQVTRWAYFVAAPGFGPVRQLGIARSGLYVVVAVLRDGQQADRTLQRLIAQTRFGDTPIHAFVEAVRQRAVGTV